MHSIPHQRVVAPYRDWQFALPYMLTNDLCHRLGHPRYEAWILQNANRRVTCSGQLLELVVAVEFDNPAKLADLVDKARLDEANGALIDSQFGLRRSVSAARGQTKVGWLDTCLATSGKWEIISG